MLFQLYRPPPPLDRFIDNFWFYQGYASPHVKERILRGATFKVVFNLQHDQFRIHDPWPCRSLVTSRPNLVARTSIWRTFGDAMISSFTTVSFTNPERTDT